MVTIDNDFANIEHRFKEYFDNSTMSGDARVKSVKVPALWRKRAPQRVSGGQRCANGAVRTEHRQMDCELAAGLLHGTAPSYARQRGTGTWSGSCASIWMKSTGKRRWRQCRLRRVLRFARCLVKDGAARHRSRSLRLPPASSVALPPLSPSHSLSSQYQHLIASLPVAS